MLVNKVRAFAENFAQRLDIDQLRNRRFLHLRLNQHATREGSHHDGELREKNPRAVGRKRFGERGIADDRRQSDGIRIHLRPSPLSMLSTTSREISFLFPISMHGTSPRLRAAYALVRLIRNSRLNSFTVITRLCFLFGDFIWCQPLRLVANYVTS